jgi:hypothetical protein
MLQVITVGRKHGETGFALLADSSVNAGAQLAEFKRLAASRTNDELAELQIWHSNSGVAKQVRFRPANPEALEASAAAAAERELELQKEERRRQDARASVYIDQVNQIDRLTKALADAEAKLEAANKQLAEQEKAAAAAIEKAATAATQKAQVDAKAKGAKAAQTQKGDAATANANTQQQ